MAMSHTVGSRMIINEVLVASPVIAPGSSTSPPSAHIPPKQSALADVANAMTWSTFSLFGGKERDERVILDYESKVQFRNMGLDDALNLIISRVS